MENYVQFKTFNDKANRLHDKLCNEGIPLVEVEVKRTPHGFGIEVYVTDKNWLSSIPKAFEGVKVHALVSGAIHLAVA